MQLLFINVVFLSLVVQYLNLVKLCHHALQRLLSALPGARLQALILFEQQLVLVLENRLIEHKHLRLLHGEHATLQIELPVFPGLPDEFVPVPYDFVLGQDVLLAGWHELIRPVGRIVRLGINDILDILVQILLTF